jgi:hypothetical protein
MYGQDLEFAMVIGAVMLVVVVIAQVAEMIFEPNKWK